MYTIDHLPEGGKRLTARQHKTEWRLEDHGFVLCRFVRPLFQGPDGASSVFPSEWTMIVTNSLQIQSKGHNHFIDITKDVDGALKKSSLKNGSMTLFVPGSTAGLTTIEYEDGVLKDLDELLEKLVPSSRPYHHDATWGDGNGFSHLRAALIGPSLAIPFSDGRLMLGQWQQIIFMDFDNRPRHREIVCQISGE